MLHGEGLPGNEDAGAKRAKSEANLRRILDIVRVQETSNSKGDEDLGLAVEGEEPSIEGTVPPPTKRCEEAVDCMCVFLDQEAVTAKVEHDLGAGTARGRVYVSTRPR